MLPKLQSALFEIKPGTKAYSRVLIPNLTIVFINSVPKILFLGEFSSESGKCFVLNETLYKVVFKGAEFEFHNWFCKFPP